MQRLTRRDLWTLEEYTVERPRFRARVMEHKRRRMLALGPHATLLFEDRLTVQYQVQEMLRAERIFEPVAIEDELKAYNPLIPDGSNFKATLMLEYEDPEERQAALARLIGIEDRVWVQVAGFPPVYAIADEDAERDTAEKTSSVHFLRFELSDAMRSAFRRSGALSAGIDHPEYRHTLDPLPEALQASLRIDINAP